MGKYNCVEWSIYLLCKVLGIFCVCVVSGELFGVCFDKLCDCDGVVEVGCKLN